MAENPLFDLLIQRLATTDDPEAKAAIIADIAFDQLPLPVATVARRCIILRWFDAAIVAALLSVPTQADAATAEEVTAQLAALPFVEKLAGERLVYHDLTRSGLLVHYGAEQPGLLKEAAGLAVPAYLGRTDQQLARTEALFCLIVAGQADEATQQLDYLLGELRNQEDWNGLLALFIICDYAAMLPFVTPLVHTAFHHHVRGIALRKLGKLQEAIAACQQAIELDENFADTWNVLAYSYYDLKRSDEAVTAFRQAIARDENFASPWNGLGNLYYNQKRYEEAMVSYQQAIERDKKFTYAWYGLGRIYYETKRYDEAITALQQAIASDEKFSWSWNGLGLVYRGLKRYDEALAAAQHAVTLGGDKLAVSLNTLGLIYYDLKRYDEAVATYQQAIKLDPSLAYIWNWLGYAYYAIQQYDEAIAAFHQAIALDETDIGPWNGLGNVYSVQQQYVEAVAAYQQAIALDEKNAYVWNRLGNVYREQKEYNEAITAYQQAIARNEKFASPWHSLGLVLRQLERWSEAIAALQGAVAIDATRWVDWIALAGAALRNGDEETWRLALAQARPLVDYIDLYTAACYESVAGNVDRALELLTQAAAQGQLDPDWAQRDPDLHWVRHDPRFWAVIGREAPT